MFIGQSGVLEFGCELGLKDLFKQVLETPVIGFHDGVLGRQIDRPAKVKAIIHAGSGKAADRLIEVVHGHCHATIGEIEYLMRDRRAAIGRLKRHRQLAGTRDDKIRGPVLVTKGMAANDDRPCPAGDQPGYVLADDRLPENRAAEDVADRAIWRFVHALEAKFLNPFFVWGDCRAFHADAIFLDRIGAVDGDLVISLVTLFDAQIVIFQINIQIGVDQLVFNFLPDDARHFIAINLDNGGFDLDT